MAVFDGDSVHISKPFFFWASERPYAAIAPINLGWIEESGISLSGGITMGEIMACNEKAAVKEYFDKHELSIEVPMLEVCDDGTILEKIFNIVYGAGHTLELPATPVIREGQVQLIVPKMEDAALCAWGIWLPRATLSWTYTMGLDGKKAVSMGIRVKALPDDGTVATAGTLVTFIEPGQTVSVIAAGKGFSIAKWDSV